ncbi:uncharacterized protein LOC128556607 [Mercenaria mercenaria]|uniref:uncharacterized protein LOC128556607 n=1 Tax=Mercenaria mercenaria TaxID=6596 RepID=UPI00234EB4CF|nr:uncharacterized protein LOC128556607 [Mercenaria mercenaria]
MSCLGLNTNPGVKYKLGGEDGCELKRVLALAVMEYKHISSYRAIVASTTAILNSEHHGRRSSLNESQGPKYKALDHRLYIVSELLRTEKEYFNNLQTVLENYAEPFRKFTSLSVEDHRVLFVGLEPIISISAMIGSKLDDAIDSWDPASTKIEFFSKYWNHYEDYAERYSAIKGDFKEEQAMHPRDEEDAELAIFLYAYIVTCRQQQQEMEQDRIEERGRRRNRRPRTC